MARPRRMMLAVGAAVLLAGMVALPAGASAKRIVPRGFFGTVLNPRLPSSTLDTQLALMARSGVESLRAGFSWGAIEPSPGVYNWSGTDLLAAASARHGISLLANVLDTPAWASSAPLSFQHAFYAPPSSQVYAGFLRTLIARYGPHGSFWAANPRLPRVPIRQWQIWNEEAANFFWVNQPWPRTYTALLRVTYAAIHSADRGATVIAGSLVGVGSDTPWAEMKALYAAGAKRYFDEISVHPFTIDPHSVTNTVNRVITIINLVRAQMRHYGDARKPIMITELAWPAAIGHVAPSRLLGLETTANGETQRLSAAYTKLGHEHSRLNINQIYWFTWASFFDPNYPKSDVSYDFAGLLRFSFPNNFTPQPALGAYSKVAAQLEGCKKGSNALHCR